MQQMRVAAHRQLLLLPIFGLVTKEARGQENTVNFLLVYQSDPMEGQTKCTDIVADMPDCRLLPTQ